LITFEQTSNSSAESPEAAPGPRPQDVPEYNIVVFVKEKYASLQAHGHDFFLKMFCREHLPESSQKAMRKTTVTASTPQKHLLEVLWRVRPIFISSRAPDEWVEMKGSLQHG